MAPGFSSGTATQVRVVQQPINVAPTARTKRLAGRKKRQTSLRSSSASLSSLLSSSEDILCQSEQTETQRAVSDLAAYEPTQRSKDKSRSIAKTLREIRSALDVLPIEHIKFSLYSFEELMSENPIIIDQPRPSKDSNPHHRTINDPRLGATGTHSHCAHPNCTNDQSNCYGHYGVILLNEPIISPGNFNRVLYVLRSVCKNCGDMLLDEETLDDLGINDYTGDDRLRLISEESVKHPCQRKAREYLRVATCTRAKLAGFLEPVGQSQVKHVCSPTVSLLERMVSSKEQQGASRGEAVDAVSDDVDEQFRQALANDPNLMELAEDLGISSYKAGKEIRCGRNPTYNKKGEESGIVKYALPGTSGDLIMPIQEIRCLFETISGNPETVRLLGIDPLNLILCAVQVIPPCFRTTTTLDSAFETDFLGARYNNIIRHNNDLDPIRRAEKRAAGQLQGKSNQASIREKLYNEVSLLYENQMPKDGNYMKNPPGIISTFKSKEGLFRQHLEGKRVNNAARTVASPDPMLKFGQIGVPRAIAKVLVYLEHVTILNMDAMMELLKAGRVNEVIRGDMRDNEVVIRIDDHNRDRFVLHPGDMVARQLQNGDYVLAGRQPTLHIASLMGHEVVIHDGLTLSIGLFETSPYNADFDGDELSIYAPLTAGAAAELRGSKSVIHNIIDPETGKPAMALVMDALTAVYRLTRKRVPIKQAIYNDLLTFLLPETWRTAMATLSERLRMHGIEEYTGRALVSSIFPPDFRYSKGGVLIEDGILKTGVLTKEHLGRAHGSIIQKMWKEYPPRRLADLLTDMSRVLNQWQLTDPISLGLIDMPQTEELRKQKQSEIARDNAIVAQMGGELDDPIEENRREQQITVYVNELEARGKSYVKPILGEDNSFIIMGSEGSGAKGGILNILQTSFIVGPQNLFGKRLPKVMRNGSVCLPYFDSDDTDPGTRGLCKNSYLDGLTPAEWVFTHWAGREGLVNTAITTAKTGDLGRRLHKMLEDLIVRQDGSVRNAREEIVQLAYSGDGFDPTMLKPTKITPNGETIRWFADVSDMAADINASFGY